MRPIKELKAFAKVPLETGETRTVSLTLTSRDFSFYDPERKAWITEPGAYDIVIGASATEVRLRGTVRLSDS